MQENRDICVKQANWTMRVYFPDQESGFVLVITMFVLILLTIIGLSATSTTEIELQIAGNDRVHKETFYHADGGSEIGIQAIEENLGCPTGFSAPGLDNNNPATFITLQGIQVADASFAYDENFTEIAGSPALLTDVPSDTARSIRVPLDPANPSDATPHTNIAVWGVSIKIPGYQDAFVSGYDKDPSGGADAKDYDIYSQHLGQINSESVVLVNYRHKTYTEGDCNY
jgi:hypothetical protein